MKCRNCGFENNDDSLFCEACGTQLIKPVSYEPDTGELNRFNTNNDYYQEQEQLERERRIRIQQREALREQRQREQNKKTIVIGIVVAAIIAVAGIGAFFGIQYFMNADNAATAQNSTQKISDSLKDQLNQDNKTTITPDVTATPEPTQPSALTPTPTEETSEEVTATVEKSSLVSKSGYSIVSVLKADASSNIEQDGYDNTADVTLDNDATTSWQEGVDGDGVGEYLYYKLGKNYDVKYITFKMGNWRDQKNYTENNRPKQITIWCGDEYFDVTIPDGMTEYCVQLSKDVNCSEIYVVIDSVYKGTAWDDTCISEVGIYGK